MSDKDLNWKFADDSVVESDALARARQQSLELGIDAIAPSVGAQSAVIAAQATPGVDVQLASAVSTRPGSAWATTMPWTCCSQAG